MHALTRQQPILLVLLTVVWGLNWPIMKIGVTGYPPLTFRALCMWIGLPVLAVALKPRCIPFTIAREHWKEVGWLAVANMFSWHALVVLAVQLLSSGRAAILGYTMPIFSALFGAFVFGQRLAGRAWGGVAMMLLAACTWAFGTQLMRRTTLPYPTLTIAFWMTVLTTLWMSGLAALFEQDRWAMPPPPVWGAIVFNAMGVFAFAQVAWLVLARGLPPIASTLPVLMIPVLGVFSGAGWLDEVLHWQDWTAVALVMFAIATVLLPDRPKGSGV